MDTQPDGAAPRPPWAIRIPRQPLTERWYVACLDGALPLYMFGASMRLQSLEIYTEVVVAARYDVNTSTLWIRLEHLDETNNGISLHHKVQWIPFNRFAAESYLARIRYPPTISQESPDPVLDALFGGLLTSTGVSSATRTTFDPRPFCDHLHSNIYVFSEARIMAAWMVWAAE
jgi:hypothetical protein